MGRNNPSVGVPPASQRRDARAKRAKQTVNKDIPALLQAYPRARKGIEATELIVDPQPVSTQPKDAVNQTKPTVSESTDATPYAYNSIPRIRLQCIDTLQAAAQLHAESKAQKRKARIGILNMASPLRPGGGFFTGATSQEESLCMRTTLYPSLQEEFYRLPEIGGIYTPDVLVFRSFDAGATDLPKNERFWVDVISSGMLRFPEVEEEAEVDGQKRYVEAKDRQLAEKKMRGVLRIAVAKRLKKLVLGAWGCGAYGNPVGDIARLWRKVLVGSPTEGAQKGSRRKGSISIFEDWGSLEIVFAIKDWNMAEVFAREFNMTVEGDPEEDIETSDVDDAELMDERTKKIAELEQQISVAKSGFLKRGLQTVLDSLREGGAQ